MRYRTIGKTYPLEVSAVGLGCMGFSHGYGPGPDKTRAIELIHYAHELGCTFFDTAESYGDGENENLVGEAIKPFRKDIILATKLHIPTGGDLEKTIREHLYASLKRLGTDYVDLYYQHRINKDIPVEEVALVMGKLIDEGLIRGWGQSQSTADEIRRANSVTPMTAVQSEYSLMERMFEKEVIPTCEELGIGFVPFSPLGAGFLSGKYSPSDVYTGDDVRRVITRFEKENMKKNQALLEVLSSFARDYGCTLAQLSLAWMINKYSFLSPIPGSRSEERIEENLAAAELDLTRSDIERIEEALSHIEIYGNRTDEDIARLKTML